MLVPIFFSLGCGSQQSPGPAAAVGGPAIVAEAGGVSGGREEVGEQSLTPITPTLRPTRAPSVTPLPTSTPTPSVTPNIISSETAPPPTASATATDLPTETHTPTPSATATLYSPLRIETMRFGEYPGSDLTLEQAVTGGDGYDRYIASYRSEGLKIFGLLTIPIGEAPSNGWPVILLCHGYIPPERYQTTEQYTAYVDYLAKRGYIVFMPDYRGHGRSEGSPSSGYGTPDYAIDVLNGIAALRRFSAADDARIGLWGHSMGGFVALRAWVTRPEQVQAGVIWAGTVATYPDIFTRWTRDPLGTPIPISTASPAGGQACCTAEQRAQLEAVFDYYGDWEENPTFWAAVSPVTYVADLTGPLQLHHGTGDRIVPADFSESFFQKLKESGSPLPHELHLYPGDNHNIGANFNAAMQRTVTFFDRNVKGEE